MYQFFKKSLPEQEQKHWQHFSSGEALSRSLDMLVTKAIHSKPR